MRNPLQDQLLKAGLVKKSQVAQVAREQARQRHGKTGAVASDQQREAAQARAERAERDRALAAERNAQARLHEQRAQARQIIETQQLALQGDIEYRFVDGGVIRSLQVDLALRAQLAAGTLVIARLGDGHAVIPRAAAGKVRARDPGMIVLDHTAAPSSDGDEDDGYDARFKVPDDLIW